MCFLNTQTISVVVIVGSPVVIVTINEQKSN